MRSLFADHHADSLCMPTMKPTVKLAFALDNTCLYEIELCLPAKIF